MVYDLSDELSRQSFLVRSKKLAEQGRVVELTEKVQRSLSQNSYLHTILSYFALQCGYTLQEVKDVYFKATCNADLFVRTRHDDILGIERKYLRSTTELAIGEMSTAIERFLNWSAQVAGIYIPPSDEYKEVLRMQYEVQRAKQFM